MARLFELQFDADAFVPDDTSPPEREFVQHRTCWSFDDASEEILRSKAFQWPALAKGGTLKIDVAYAMVSATSGDVRWSVKVEAITPLDAVSLAAAESFDSANHGDDTVPGTAGYLAVHPITLTHDDSVAAGDYVRLYLSRPGADGADTATGDARFWMATVYEEI